MPETPDSPNLIEQLDEASSYLKNALGDKKPVLGIILGSGLGPFADTVTDPVKIPFADVPYMKTSTATSHVGQFVCGECEGKTVLVMQGRLHGYEGFTAQEVAFPVWLMHMLGIETLITTNSAGAINPYFQIGDFCIMRDHINFTGRNPVAGADPDRISERFFSLFAAYDPRLQTLAKNVAGKYKIPVQVGVYVGVLGPSFETAAEILMFERMGADTVAMSVVEETIAARHVGMRVLGISLISNMACGVASASPSDEEVLDVAGRRIDAFDQLMKGIVHEI
ncbi:MAG: purine-nucleoside phosphorylase [Eggerthellaceae bacterium]|nr:purine-nucleoside phosphorylase [Eggerthellaceae bacterium]